MAFPSAAAPVPPRFEARAPEVLPPGALWAADVVTTAGRPRGQMVMAFATKPLVGPAGDGEGLPTGVSLTSPNWCTVVAGHTTVYACPVVDGGRTVPGFRIAADAPNSTTYLGFAYVPEGGDIARGVTTAQTAAAVPADGQHGVSQMTVKTAAQAALSTIDAPPLPNLSAGASARQRVHVHAVDAGEFAVSFALADGQPSWRDRDVLVSEVIAGAGAVCTLHEPRLFTLSRNFYCRLEPGEHTIEYTLSAPTGVQTWRAEADLSYNIYSRSDAPVTAATAPFTLQGSPLRLDHRLLATDGSGQLYAYEGTGRASDPLRTRSLIGGGWQTYTALTKLAPVTENLIYRSTTPTNAYAANPDDLVGRDRDGVLWFYQRDFHRADLYAPRTRIGGGWNVYDQLTGAGDLTADGKADLVARDKAGVLWLYRGTGDGRAPFASRIRIGGGWNAYNLLAASGDVTGDGTPDLMARDAAGTLWIYTGTGKATAPFASRTRIGGGWNSYTQISVVGDINRDGNPDLVARDSAGVLWLYTATGTASTPFAPRTRIGGGWNTYTRVL
ncbi:FG-GAP repeat domain-containing protein [Streptomyces melanogenes]|uniref:FG-GAP repeat domain-containing protein n=1 Tax=Streptomyces melanogenes TaxID=67326 RepID=UPI003792FF08